LLLIDEELQGNPFQGKTLDFNGVVLSERRNFRDWRVFQDQHDQDAQCGYFIFDRLHFDIQN
jgi:hypothetical protein